ncbi:MAG: methyltransferase domain-containing protein [Polyangia bacterium]
MIEQANSNKGQPKSTHTCPYWIGLLLASPVRRLFENPKALVLPLVKSGDRVLELGPALGFFTLSVAEAVGATGKVVCVEVQAKMLARLGKRLAKRGLRERADLRLCSHQDLGLDDLAQSCDLALAIHVLHETLSPATTVTALAPTLKPGGQLLIIEPPGHCSPSLFQAEVAAAEQAGLVRTAHPRASARRLLALLKKPA